MGKKELAKPGRQLHKGVTYASAGLEGAVEASIDNSGTLSWLFGSLEGSVGFGT